MVWWSKSGRIYEITDTDIACDDIVFELEPFEPQLYFSQLNYREPHPFKTEGLAFELEVISFDVHSTLELDIHEGKENLIPPFIEKVYKYIETYNSKSVAQDRKYGVVHNSSITQKGNKLVMYIDFGSTGFRFCNQLLKMISKTNYFSRVIMSS